MLSIYYSLRNAVIGNTVEVLKYAVPIMLVILLVKKFFGKEKKIYLKKSLYEFLLVGYVITVLLLTDILHIGLDDFLSMHFQPNLIPIIDVIADRYADINDLFWNVSGAMVGALVYKVVEMLCSNVLFSKARTS